MWTIYTVGCFDALSTKQNVVTHHLIKFIDNQRFWPWAFRPTTLTNHHKWARGGIENRERKRIFHCTDWANCQCPNFQIIIFLLFIQLQQQSSELRRRNEQVNNAIHQLSNFPRFIPGDHRLTFFDFHVAKTQFSGCNINLTDFGFEKARKCVEEEKERGRDRERRLRATNPKSLFCESLSDLNKAVAFHLADENQTRKPDTLPDHLQPEWSGGVSG